MWKNLVPHSIPITCNFLEPQSFTTNTNMLNWLGLHKPQQQGWRFKQQKSSTFICLGHLVTIYGSLCVIKQFKSAADA